MTATVRRWGVAATCAVLAAACQSEPVRIQGAVAFAPRDVLSRALPDDLRFDRGELARELPVERRQQFDALLAECMRVSGAHAVTAAVAIPGQGTWSGALARDGDTPIDAHTRFHAASIGKAMTAALVLQLVGEGRFALDTPIARWFPELRGAEAITVDHLLTHTSGLVDADVGPPAGDGGDGERAGQHRHRTPEQILAAVRRGPRLFEPGEMWSYCNAGYQLLGTIVEREREAPFAEVLHQRLLEPLGMNDTCVVTPANQREVLFASRVDGGSGFDAVDYAAPLAAGPVASTPRDLIGWHAALLGGEVLPGEMSGKLFDRLYPMSPGSLWWGRGVMLLRMPAPIGEVYYSAGGIVGFGSVLAWIPSKRAFVAVMVADETPPGPFLWRLANAL